MTRRSRNSRQHSEADFTVHLQLARAQTLQRRLNRAAVLLLLSALLSWLFKVPFPLQLALVLAAGAAAFAWPVRGAQAWSRNWIRTHAGLAYETALQLEQQPRDAFGLRVTVRSHARTAIARMDRPQYQSWWLAGLVLTALILLLPALNFSSPFNLPGPRSPAPGSVPVTEQQDERTEAAAEGAAEPETAEPELPEAADQAGQPPGDAAAPDEAGTDRAAASATDDGAVLDRFLDNLRPRPAEEEAGQVQTASTQPLGEQSDADAGDTAGDASEPGTEQQDAGEADTEAGSGPGAAETEDMNDEIAGEAGETEAAGQEEGEAASQTEEAAGGPESEGGASTAAEGDTLEEGTDDTGIGGGADDSVGTDGQGEPSERLAAGGEAEFLEGRLAGDSASPAGSVRLPPFTDVEVPRGSNATEFTRAAERAVTEGQVPLEYQEIIRNYFRP